MLGRDSNPVLRYHPVTVRILSRRWEMAAGNDATRIHGLTPVQSR
jgi:hypothetical protein